MDLPRPTPLGIAFHPSPACGHCWKYEADLPANAKLKRCVGCSVALYCSRDCQKAAWATHKRLCRPSGPSQQDDQFAGHATPLELFHSLNEWVKNTHEYAFGTLMSAAVLLNGGIAANFAEPCIVVFKLTRVDEPKNPAMAFRLKVEVPRILKGEALRASVAEGQAALHAACQLQTELIRRANDTDPTYAGSLLAMVWVEGTEVAAYHPYPIYGLRSHDTGPLNERTSPIFEGVVGMCIGTMNAGLVLQAPRENGPPEPDVGVLVKRKKKWDWKKRERWAWKRDVALPSGLDPCLVWAAFHML